MFKKALYFLFVSFSFLFCINFAQAAPSNVFKFDFEDPAKRATADFTHSNFYTADDGSVDNINAAAFGLVGSASTTAGPSFTSFVAGTGSAGSLAPSSDHWDSGQNLKYWCLRFSTVGFTDLKLSSQQFGSPTGPLDFKVQWSLNYIDWTDLASSSLKVSDSNWTSGFLNNISLPVELEGVSTVYLRWIIDSDISIEGGAINSIGANRIDNIILTGEKNETIVAWDFEDSAKRSLTSSTTFYTADDGILANKNISEIKLIGSDYKDFVNGAGSVGSEGRAHNSNHWNSGIDNKYWQISFSTLGYKNLRLSSKHNGSNTGPRDFKVQWSLDGFIWNDVASSSVEVFNNSWNVNSVLDNVALPLELESKSNVYLRWVMTSNNRINISPPGMVSSVGTSHIDDIVITGENINMIANWDFEDSAKRALTSNSIFYTADDGTLANKDISEIKLNNALFTAFADGSGGVGSFSSNSSSWDAGQNIKYWQTSFSTVGYVDLKLSSKQKGSDIGPRDFKVQWSLDSFNWTDLASSSLQVATNSWSLAGSLNNVSLPLELESKPNVYLRWIMDSNTSIDGGTVLASGTNMIDDVVIFSRSLKKYSITYNDNNSSGGFLPADQIKTHDIDLVLRVNRAPLYKDNHIFTGWNTSADGSGDHYDEIAVFTANNEVVLYAEWEALVCPVIANAATYNPYPICGVATCKNGYKLEDGACIFPVSSSHLPKPSIGDGEIDYIVEMNKERKIDQVAYEKFNTLLYTGSKLFFNFLNNNLIEGFQYKLEIIDLDIDKNKVKIFLNSQIIELFSEDEKMIDLNNDGFNDISIRLNEIFVNRIDLTVTNLNNKNEIDEGAEDNIKEDNIKIETELDNNKDKEGLIKEDKSLVSRLSGQILLQVEDLGKAWYLDPVSLSRYFLGSPSEAFDLMRFFGLGITNKDFDYFKKNGVSKKLLGRIVLTVEENGEAYYINPIDSKFYYLGRPIEAFNIIKNLSLGINNNNIDKIKIGNISTF